MTYVDQCKQGERKSLDSNDVVTLESLNEFLWMRSTASFTVPQGQFWQLVLIKE
jgi:hypothetical protein